VYEIFTRANSAFLRERIRFQRWSAGGGRREKHKLTLWPSNLKKSLDEEVKWEDRNFLEQRCLLIVKCVINISLPELRSSMFYWIINVRRKMRSQRYLRNVVCVCEVKIQGGSNMTGTNCDLFTKK
jgi:hypothetical protein